MNNTTLETLSGLTLDVLELLNTPTSQKELSMILDRHYVSISKVVRKLKQLQLIKVHSKIDKEIFYINKQKYKRHKQKNFYPIDPSLGINKRYLISKEGELLNTETKKIIKVGTCHYGYQYYNFTINGTRKPIKIHKIVARTFLANPEKKPCLNHKSGVKTNNKLENLEWVTYSENMLHAYDTGLRGKKKHG